MLHIIVTALADMLQTLPLEPPYPHIAPPPKARQVIAEPAVPGLVNTPAVSHIRDGGQHKQRSSRRHVPTAKEQQAESRLLRQHQNTFLGEPKHAPMREARQKLPAFSKRKDLLTKLSQHSVLVISGATGIACCSSAVIRQHHMWLRRNRISSPSLCNSCHSTYDV